MEIARIQEYIWENRLQNPERLALTLHNHPVFDGQYVAQQVSALRHAVLKMPLWYREGIKFPSKLSLEQASSAQTAAFKATLLGGTAMADLTGGLGVDAYYFSKQFESVTHVEQDAEISACAHHNFEVLGADNVTCHHQTAADWLNTDKATYDLIYLDPARRDTRGGRVAQLEDCTPNILAIKALLFQKTSRILLKTAPMLDISLAISQLAQVSQIWVISADNECKEVVYLLEKDGGKPMEEIEIKVVCLKKEGDPILFNFTFGAEKECPVGYALPSTYLIEPDPAILKAGAFKTFAQRYGLQKLNPNSHLYTGADLPAHGVPGRIFKIHQVCKYDKKALILAVPAGKANISARNFPDTPEQIRKKIGLKDGGQVYLFATTDMNGDKVVMVCAKA